MDLRTNISLNSIIFYLIFGLTIIFCGCYCEQIETEAIDTLTEESRLRPQRWHLIDTTPSNHDFPSSDIYDYHTMSWLDEDRERPYRRRRPRLRKRRRRPQRYRIRYADSRDYWQDDDDSVISDDIYPPATYKYPPRTERIREPLAALEKEQRLYELRDRRKHEFESEMPVTIRDKTYRKPISNARLEESSEMIQRSSEKPVLDRKKNSENADDFNSSEIPHGEISSTEDHSNSPKQIAQIIKISTTVAPLENRVTPRYTKLSRRWPFFNSSTPPPVVESSENIDVKHLNEEKSTTDLDAVEKLDFNHISSSTTSRSYSAEFKNDASSESATNIVELATIIALRDRPSIRSSQNAPKRKFLFPSLSKAKIFAGAKLRTTKPSPSPLPLVTEEKEKTKNEIVEETETTTLNYPIRFKVSPTNYSYHNWKPRNRQVQIRMKESSSSQSSASSASSSSSLESHSKEQTSSDESRPGSSSNSMEKEPSTNKRYESVEEKLKNTRTEINLINKFSNFGETDFEVEGKNQEIFEPLFQLRQRNQIITPRNDNFTDDDSTTSKGIQQALSTEKLDVTETNPSLFIDLTSETNDRLDLMELMKDPRSSDKLFKILAQRNMTINELIEHRRRGSSQLHLAEIIQNKNKTITKLPSSKEPVISSSFDENMDIVTAFDNFPNFNLANLKSIKPDEIKVDSQGSSYFTSIIDIEPTDEVYQDNRSSKVAFNIEPRTQARQQSRSIANSESATNQKDFNMFPSWKTFSIANYASQEDSILNNEDSNVFSKLPQPPPSHSKKKETAAVAAAATIGDDYVLKIENEVSKAHDLVDLELSGHGFKGTTVIIENNQISNGIRSAIIASAAIIGTSLTVFLIIFVTCRLRHNRKKQMLYTETYNAIKRRFPIISAARSKSSISNSSSPMIFSGSKNNQLSTIDPNSPEIQEYLFETMRKEF